MVPDSTDPGHTIRPEMTAHLKLLSTKKPEGPSHWMLERAEEACGRVVAGLLVAAGEDVRMVRSQMQVARTCSHENDVRGAAIGGSGG